jgi:hypothetical protein
MVPGMGAFESFSVKMQLMDETGRATEKDALRSQCICAGCPTYNECMQEKGELLFCIEGKSPACTFEKKGCICPMCPVTGTAGLSKAYYCVRGTEWQQRGMTHEAART